MKLSFSPFEISERTRSDCYHFKGLKECEYSWRKTILVQNSCLFRAPLGAAPVGSHAMPWREFGGAAGTSGGGERAFPRPLGRRRGASSSASLAEGALGSSGVPSARSHSSAACDTRRRRRPAAGTIGLGETREHPSCWRSNAGRSGRFRDRLDLEDGESEARRSGPDTHTVPGPG